MSTRHVQTELDEDEYEQFRNFADERGVSLKEAGREALIEWVESQQHVDPFDPAFTVLEELDDDLPETAETDAREESDTTDEWTGQDIDFKLAEAPDPSN